MPDDYYVSQYSGEEIDALLGGAGAGTVRYDAAQTLTDAQKAQARENINAAPGGGGVMESVLEVSASSASESYDTFCAKLDAVLATMPAASVKFLRVYPPQYYGAESDICALFKDSNDYAAVYTIGSYNKNRQGFRMIKYKRDSSDPAGQWDPLEYINPPMQLGVEYRTTERYLGKPVYCKLVNFGALPNATQKVVKHNIPNVSSVISVYGSAQDQAIVVGAFGMQVTGINADNTNVAIWTSADLSNYSAYVAMKYTKITD